MPKRYPLDHHIDFVSVEIIIKFRNLVITISYRIFDGLFCKSKVVARIEHGSASETRVLRFNDYTTESLKSMTFFNYGISVLNTGVLYSWPKGHWVRTCKTFNLVCRSVIEMMKLTVPGA